MVRRRSRLFSTPVLTGAPFTRAISAKRPQVGPQRARKSAPTRALRRVCSNAELGLRAPIAGRPKGRYTYWLRAASFAFACATEQPGLFFRWQRTPVGFSNCRPQLGHACGSAPTSSFREIRFHCRGGAGESERGRAGARARWSVRHVSALARRRRGGTPTRGGGGGWARRARALRPRARLEVWRAAAGLGRVGHLGRVEAALARVQHGVRRADGRAREEAVARGVLLVLPPLGHVGLHARAEALGLEPHALRDPPPADEHVARLHALLRVARLQDPHRSRDRRGEAAARENVEGPAPLRLVPDHQGCACALLRSAPGTPSRAKPKNHHTLTRAPRTRFRSSASRSAP